jgi:hypothetical protein
VTARGVSLRQEPFATREPAPVTRSKRAVSRYLELVPE